MLTPNHLHEYQKRAVNHQCTNPNTMLWLDMGLGKTAITLTSIAHLIKAGFLRGVLIVAPIRVVRLVWRQEAAKWTHTSGLTFSVVAGTVDQRTRMLLRPADVYIVNYENLEWLSSTLGTYFVKKGKPLPFNGLVWDEVSKMKNSTTKRVKSFKRIADHFDWTTGLTGTPASNGYKDLHGQYLVVDKGTRLGRTKTEFEGRFFHKVGPYKKVAHADTEDVIKGLIGDITLEMSAADYNPLPDLIVNNVEIDLPPNLRAAYDEMERQMFIQLDNGQGVEIFNQAALMTKCLQYSNGAIYPVSGLPIWEPIHDLKLDALEEIIESAQGNPVLCSYAFRSDAERIMARFKHLDPINLTECKSESSLTNAMRRWKSGNCPLLVGHPACLHPSTKVLTELRGWVRLGDVLRSDRVFDGVEFVRHNGVSYSGYQKVVDVFGITATPDHKFLVNGQWMKGQDVRNCRSSRREALYEYQGDDKSVGEMLELRHLVRDGYAERCEAQQGRRQSLHQLCGGNLPQSHQHSNMAHLATNASPRIEHIEQKLRRSRYTGVSNVAQFSSILRGHVADLCGQSDAGKSGREWSVQQVELHMVGDLRATSEQAQQPKGDIPGSRDASCGVSSPLGRKQDDVSDEAESWNVRGRGCSEREGFSIREGSACERAHVYDIVDCGPRHQFLVCNDDGDMFISHNSMGHGIDGLQDAGSTLVWYGLTWSLDLYEQFNARLRRQGQGKPVTAHRLMVASTLDQAQAMALDDKAVTQAGLREAVKSYRVLRGV